MKLYLTTTLLLFSIFALAQTNTFPSSGNTGIGTISPSSALQLVGEFRLGGNTAYTDLLIQPTTPLTGYNQTTNFTPATIPGSGIARTALHLKSQVSGGSNIIDLLVDGNVGIGLTNPTEKLEVNGKIRAKEIKVETSGWPDYVFSPSYKKMPLAELEKFIQKNGHLPEIPSAKEVELNGVELGEMNKLLLKKIEELTLHLIEQGKEIEALKKIKKSGKY